MTNRAAGFSLAALAGLVLVAACGSDDDSDAQQPAPPKAETSASEESPAAGRERDPVRTSGAPKVSTWTDNLDVPWELVFLPDGRALVTERPGQVRLISRRGRLSSRPVARIKVESTSEDGLLGMALDPSFRRNGLVYIYRSTAGGNELLRFKFSRNRLRRQRVLVRGIAQAPNHNGGRVHFGPDKRLYFSTGDAQNMSSAQDRGSLNGKILRLSLRKARGSGGRPEVFTYGHRNPQGFDWEPGTRRMIEGEHGASGNDEVNILHKGANYGWPEIEGGERRDGMVTPVAFYSSSIAPSGSTFVKKGGSAWSGDYLIGCLVGEQIRRVGFDGDRVTTNEALFEGNYGRIRTVVEGPDGALYALTNNRDGRGSPQAGDDRILRIVPPAG